MEEQKYENVQITVYFDHKNAHNDRYDPTTKEDRNMMTKIGAIQTIIVKEKSDDGDVKGWISRLRLDKDTLAGIFSRAFVHRNSQRWPMQIIIDDDDGTTRIENVWIERMGYSYTTNNYILATDIDFIAEQMVE